MPVKHTSLAVLVSGALAVGICLESEGAVVGDEDGTTAIVCATYAEDDESKAEAEQSLIEWARDGRGRSGAMRAVAICRLHELAIEAHRVFGGRFDDSLDEPVSALLDAALAEDPHCLSAHYLRSMSMLLLWMLEDPGTNEEERAAVPAPSGQSTPWRPPEGEGGFSSAMSALVSWADHDPANALPWYLMAWMELGSGMKPGAGQLGRALELVEAGNERQWVRSWPVWSWLLESVNGGRNCYPCQERMENSCALLEMAFRESLVETKLRGVARDLIDLAVLSEGDGLRGRCVEAVWEMSRKVVCGRPESYSRFSTGIAIADHALRTFSREEMSVMLGERADAILRDWAEMGSEAEEVRAWLRQRQRSDDVDDRYAVIEEMKEIRRRCADRLGPRAEVGVQHKASGVRESTGSGFHCAKRSSWKEERIEGSDR